MINYLFILISVLKWKIFEVSYKMEKMEEKEKVKVKMKNKSKISEKELEQGVPDAPTMQDFLGI